MTNITFAELAAARSGKLRQVDTEYRVRRSGRQDLVVEIRSENKPSKK